MITHQYRYYFKGIIKFATNIFKKAGFTPNKITILSLVLGLLICLLFVWNRNPAFFGCMILLVGLLDVIDGELARTTNQSTKFGSYLDAVCDRFYEAAATLAAAYVSGHWILSFLLLTGSQLTSYAKARAGMEVKISNREWPDLIQRFDRALIFTSGLFLWGIFPGTYGGKDIFFFTLVILDILVFVSLFQRIIRAKRIIQERDHG